MNESKIPCLYVFSLGYVKDLRNSMSIHKSINDENIVIKYGMTDNLTRCSSEHLKEYQENIENVKLRIMFFNYIDKKYINEAERELKEYVSDDVLKFKKYKELAILNSKHKKFLKSHFNYINDNFGGELESINQYFETEKQNFLHELKYKELEYQKNIERIKRETNKEIERLQREKELITVNFKAENDMLRNEKELVEKDNKILQMEKELVEKDNKILQMEKRFLELQIKT